MSEARWDVTNTATAIKQELDESEKPKELRSKEENFTVEKIVKKRVRGGKTQYLLKWAGFSEADNSWEDADNLVGCQDLLNEFNSREEQDVDKKSEKVEEKSSKKTTIK